MAPEITDFARRLEALYVPAVSDALDKMGYWNQLLSPGIIPLRLGDKIAGPAFTAKGSSTVNTTTAPGSRIVSELPPGAIAVWDTSGDTITGHWGELMSNTAILRGCRGAVVDGGIRDTQKILDSGFSVWHKYRSAADARGRWTITESNIPIMIDGVVITPGDYIFADSDGVVVIPQSLLEKVISDAETIVHKEDAIRDAVGQGRSLGEMYEHFKSADRPPRTYVHPPVSMNSQSDRV